MRFPVCRSGCPQVFVIPAVDEWLLLAPGTGTTALVNVSAVSALARCTRGEGVHELSAELRMLREEITRACAPGDGTDERNGKLVIIPTRACNMQCVYCDFAAEGASACVLDPRLACRFVDYYVEKLREREEDTVRVHFFGGEPLVARNCTETIVHYVRALCARTNMVPWFELTTNGLFDSALVPFVGDYFDTAVVSVDGTKRWHDYNRKGRDGRGTYEGIAANLRLLARYPVEICLRMCVTNRSVDMVADLAECLCREFDFDVLSLEMLSENDGGRAHGLRAPEPLAFAAGVLRAERRAAGYGVRVVHGPSELAGPRTSSCPLGQGTLMLTPDGHVTACYLDPKRWEERGLDLTLGHVDAKAGVQLDSARLDAVDAMVRSKQRCERCFCRYTCAGGCHVDQTPPGCQLEYDERCRAIRVITAARVLRALGCHDRASALAHERSAMTAITDHPDDRLEFWRGTT